MILDFLKHNEPDYNNVINIDCNEPHEVAEIMCVKCFYRFIGVMKAYTPLKDLECPKCKTRGTIIKTGQEYEDEE